MLRAALRCQHPDGFTAFLGQPATHEVGIRNVQRDQQFPGWLPFLVIELFNGRANELFISGIGRFEPEKVLAANQQTSPHKEQLQVDGSPMSCETDDVLIDGSGLRDSLPLERALDLEDPIPQPGRLLKLLTSRGGFHVSTEFINQFSVVSFQKLTYLSDDPVIVRLRLLSCTGRHAAFDLKFDTGPFGGSINVNRAGGERKYTF